MRIYKVSLPFVAEGEKLEGAFFDLIFSLALIWFLIGVCLDAWAHTNLARLETFFTPWHAVLYSGAFVTAAVLFVAICYNRSRVSSWREAIPAGYELTVLAVAGFLIGGVGDMLWHVIFGVERNIDAEFSPTHIWLMVCGCVFLASPYRIMYHQTKVVLIGWQKLCLALAQSLLMMLPSIIMVTFHPLAHFWPTSIPTWDGQGQVMAVVAILFYALIVTGFALFTLRHWRLFPGFFTISWGLTSVVIATLSNSILTVVIAVLAGMLTDGAYYVLQPNANKLLFYYRLFAMLVPFLLYTVYFLVLQIFTPTGVIWSIHLSIGSIVVSSLLGLLLTYMITPPLVKYE